jgi:hypothetical protein
MRNGLKDIRRKLDTSRSAERYSLAIQAVIKAHGSSNAYAIRSAILQAKNAVESNVVKDIQDNIEYMKIEDSASEAMLTAKGPVIPRLKSIIRRCREHPGRSDSGRMRRNAGARCLIEEDHEGNRKQTRVRI